MHPVPTPDGPAQDRPRPPVAPVRHRGAVTAAAIGNFIEWYDFVLYGYFATIIAHAYFPSGDEAAALLLTFAVFGVSFFVRPAGGVLFGHVGDRHGRRLALSLIIILISLSTALIALVPSYETIGIAAPLLILLLRCLQGLSAGGEWTGAASYVVEHAPPGRRAFYGSWQTVTIVLGMMVAALTSLILGAVLSAPDLDSWGWRLPFLLSVPLGLAGLWLRLRLSESPEFSEVVSADRVERAPLRATLRADRRSILLCAALVCSPTMCTYVLLVYGPTFLIDEMDMSGSRARAAGFTAMAVLAVLIVPLARLCDRVGRRPFLIGGAAWVLLAAVPGFYLLHSGNLAVVALGLVVIVVGEALMLAPQPAVFSELFPTSRRYSGLSLGYNLGVMIFGGAGPFAAAALIDATGSAYAPAMYLCAGALISLIAALRTPETLRASLRGGPGTEDAA
ncbi:MFS transporter [Actinomadura roseirufa]|uniref:MFS transporter n=1 Tax=Actinomadura roseirufa TaxID=2094049 RepID=UPI001040F178|nr:MFS transporter [Actinomadura roseirufa]